MSRVEIIGAATLYLGDAREIVPRLADPAGVLTDPPYGIAYKSGHATDELWKAGRSIVGDEDATVRDAVLALWAGRRDIPRLAFGSRRKPLPDGTGMILTWDKGPALGMGDLTLPWKPTTEEIYVLGSGFIGERDKGAVVYHPPVQSMAKNGRQHPNEKPVGLLRVLLQSFPAGTILDPFMGSGSTGVACMVEGRSFVGIECVPVFFDIACRRIEQAQRQSDMFIGAAA